VTFQSPLRNRVARRIFAEFVLVLVVPLIGLSWFGIHQASRQLEQQAFSHLAFSAKDTAMSVVTRVQAIELDIEIVLGDFSSSGILPEASANTRLLERLQQTFHDLSVHTSQGRIDVIGSVPDLPALSPQAAAHLGTGAMALECLDDGRLVVLRDLTRFGLGDGTLVGVLRPERLLSLEGAQGLSLFCGRTLLATSDPELFSAASLAGKDVSTARLFSLDLADGAYFAVTREAFLRPQFGQNLMVLLAEPVESAMAPIAQFRLLFQLTVLLVFLVVFLVSLKRVRENLRPISELQAATQRLAAGDLDTRVVVETGDEFQDLASAFNTMATRVRERTEQLVEANHAKNRFLANVSHEIRTPMTSILGYTDLCAADPDLSKGMRESIEVIRTSGRHLLRVINDVLDFARMEAGKLEIRTVPCDPRQVLAEAVQIVEPQIRGRLWLERSVAADVPGRVRTDPDRLRQILVNLLSNAAKFTETGGITVAMELRTGGPTAEISCTVTDTGPGIDDALKQRLFQPFSPGDEAMSRRHGGTGLGLSIARALARLLGGDLACSSTLGRGSTFTLTIRAEVEAPEAPASPLPARAPGPGTPSSRVLVAEDVAVNRRLVALQLRSAGHTVAEAENGRQALELVLAAWRSDEPFELVLMDMQMPVMDGYQAVRALRAAGYPGPVLAFTAHAVGGERERCLAAGCDELVTKPIVRASLLEAVLRHARHPGDASRVPGPASSG